MNTATLTSTPEPTGFAALPFVRPASGRGKRRVPASHWAVPATGGYGGGYTTGMAMATLFLKFLRQNPDAGAIPLHLTWIVAAFAERFEAEGAPRWRPVVRTAGARALCRYAVSKPGSSGSLVPGSAPRCSRWAARSIPLTRTPCSPRPLRD